MLAATDVATAWVGKEPLPATAENVAKARDFLSYRVSLGWTNLIKRSTAKRTATVLTADRLHRRWDRDGRRSRCGGICPDSAQDAGRTES